MQDEARLIEQLRQARATPPAAPQDEWFAVAQRTVNAPAHRSGALAWSLGLGVACAGLWLVVPLARSVSRPAVVAAPALAPAEELDQALEPLQASPSVPEDVVSEGPGNEIQAVLDAV